MEPHVRNFLEQKITELENAEKTTSTIQAKMNIGVQIGLFKEALNGPRELWYTAIIAAPSGPQSFASKDFREFCEWVSYSAPNTRPDAKYIQAWFNIKIHSEFKDYYAIEMPRMFYWDFLTA